MLMYFQITAVGWTTGVQFPVELGIIPFITTSTLNYMIHLAFYAIRSFTSTTPIRINGTAL